MFNEEFLKTYMDEAERCNVTEYPAWGNHVEHEFQITI
jgi:hypothetical protein